MGKLATFARFAAQQLREKARIRAELEAARPPLDTRHAVATAALRIGAGDDWRPTSIMVRAGQSFTVEARGAVWLSRALAMGIEPRVALWVRIGGAAPIAKLIANRTRFTAWADGPVELGLKTRGEWASPAGDVLPGDAMKASGGVEALVALWPEAAPADMAGTPKGWRYLWRLGDGRIFADSDEGIAVDTHGDVGILQLDAAADMTEDLRLRWDWRVDALPSALPEDLAPTHDYLSIAVEFEDGRDLTYMWSAGLPHDHVFRCPLPWWCERETHWVIRSGSRGLGQWLSEERLIAADCRRAYGEVPARVARIWLIANSVFQRRHGRAAFRGIGLS